MTTSGKEFITNFRNVRLNPFDSASSPSLITRGDIVKRNRVENEEMSRIRAEDQEYIDEMVKETQPLRDAIKEYSGGKVVVDKSIYKETALKRIFDSVKKMQESDNGLFQMPYVTISDGYTEPGVLGGAAHGRDWHFRFNPDIKTKFFPSDYFHGTKNTPYRITLRDANYPFINDWIASDDGGWSINIKNDNSTFGTESATHAHELAHTIYYNALKKTQNPLLPSNGQTKEKVEAFRRTHPSLQEIFDIAAKNTGYKTVQEAAASISGYAEKDAKEDIENGGLKASSNWSSNYLRLPEVFAEAYVDYLYNKDNASEYSKELIKLYANYINDYNSTFDNKVNLEPGALWKNSNSEFINNLRGASAANNKYLQL